METLQIDLLDKELGKDKTNHKQVLKYELDHQRKDRVRFVIFNKKKKIALPMGKLQFIASNHGKEGLQNRLKLNKA